MSALCLSLQHLRSLHFRRSGPVDPGTLRTLANYKRASESPRALDEEDGDRGPLVSNHPGVNAGEPTHRVYPDSLTTRGHRARGFTDWEAQVAVVQTRRLSVTGDMRGLECLTLSDVPASERGLGSLWARGAATRSSLRRLVFLGTTVDLHQLCAGAAAVRTCARDTMIKCLYFDRVLVDTTASTCLFKASNRQYLFVSNAAFLASSVPGSGRGWLLWS